MKILRLVIECATPLHCGGGHDDILDQPVVRDAFGLWSIPATSLAGSLRSLGLRIDSDLTEKIFGQQEGEKSIPSLVWCETGLLLDFDSIPAVSKFLNGKKPDIKCETFVRDHVCIDLETGTGVDGGKYDMEIVPAGARFFLCFRCDGWDRELRPEEVKYFDELCEMVLNGELEIGGKNGLGYGHYRVISHEYADLDLKQPTDMQHWLNWNEWALPDSSAPIPASEKRSARENLNGWLEIPLACMGPVLIGGGKAVPGQDGEADMLFALTPSLVYDKKDSAGIEWRPVLPGSSIRGVLRHAIYAIIRNLNIMADEGKRILDNMFGIAAASVSKCGKIFVQDAPLGAAATNEDFKFVQHVALDRFSGAALEGALFSEQPFWLPNAKTTLKIGVKNLEDYEAALFFHALLDLFEGSLAIGSGVNRGNGRLMLPYWEEDRQKALRSITCRMDFNGENIWKNLPKYAEEWDKALKKRTSA